MKNYNNNGVWYQVNYDEKEDFYSLNWANSRGIGKGHYSKKLGVNLEERILIKVVDLYRSICEKATQELNKNYQNNKRDFDIIDYEVDMFDKEYRKLIAKNL